ncbi:MAG: YicC family protein [Gemmatimonadetes bacterium]|nr:MAG: YicC family protein [Gemmatimonadota bacterium]
MPRSMTGFGSADGAVVDGRVRVEIRTVNHRYFNPQFKLPSELAGVEGQLRDRLRQLLDRGHVAVSVRWLEPPSSESAIAVDLTRARQVVAAAKELKKQLRLKGEVDLAFVARQPDVITLQGDGGSGGSAGSAAAAWSDLERIVERAAQEVLAMRAREGRALAAELAQRLEALESGARVVEERAPARLVAEHERLKKAVSELAAGAQVDQQRLAVEIALMADRVDITEELVRLRTHLAACRETLAGEGAVGRRLGFLAQELLREVNTIGSKANDAAITQTVIAMKGELEKLREQLENLE